MTEIFNTEEENKLTEIIQDYRNIYDKAAFLAVQMEQMETEMSDLIKQMDVIKENETAIYVTAAERSGNTMDEVRTAAANLILEKQQNTVAPEV